MADVRNWFWPFGPWYLIAAVWAAAGFGEIALGDFPLGAPVIAIGAAGIIVLAVRETYWRRTDEYALRRQLENLIRERAGDTRWLNRDARLLFGAGAGGPRWARSFVVIRADEDQALELREQGRAAVTGEAFAIPPLAIVPGVPPRVTRHPVGAVVSSDGEIQSPAVGRGGDRAAARAGLLHPDPAELTELISQFRDAEPLPADGQDGDE
jgi:hypothetical protein